MWNRHLPRLLHSGDFPRLPRRGGRVWLVALAIGVVMFLILGI